MCNEVPRAPALLHGHLGDHCRLLRLAVGSPAVRPAMTSITPSPGTEKKATAGPDINF